MEKFSGTYNYSALNEHRREIRVLALLPGHFNDPIRCRLITCSLAENPVYDALSYMWGDPNITRQIILENENRIPVTVSLECALRHIRLDRETRLLWADAVCINQRDIQERTNQVELMKSIYSQASTVRVWIDCELPVNSEAFVKLQSLNDQSKPEDLGDDPRTWDPLIPLLQNPYWERLWVQQELIFAPRLKFHCRHIIIPGDNLMAFQLQMVRKCRITDDFMARENPWVQLGEKFAIGKTPSRHLSWWRKMVHHHLPADKYTLETDDTLYLPLSSLGIDPRKYASALTTPIYMLGALRNAQMLKVTDPRDRVIASLNLAIDYEDDGYRSYSMSAAELYLGIARLLPFQCNSLQFLPQAKLLREPDSIAKDLPSWVPNWNAPCSAGYFWLPFQASRDLPMHPLPFGSDMNVLIAHGFRYDTIKHMSPYSSYATAPLSAIRDIALSIHTSSTDILLLLESLARALTEPAIEELSNDPQFVMEENVLFASILLRFVAISSSLSLRSFVLHPTRDGERFTSTLSRLHELQHLDNSPIGQLNHIQLAARLSPDVDKCRRFNHFVYLSHHTLSSGNLVSTTAGHIAVVEATAAVASADELWILFGCPTPMVLRRRGGYYTVVSPAYVPGIMHGETAEGVRIEEGRDFYRAGKWGWTVQNIQLR